MLRLSHGGTGMLDLVNKFVDISNCTFIDTSALCNGNGGGSCFRPTTVM